MNIPVILTKQQAVRATSLSIIAALALTVFAPLHALASTPDLSNNDSTVNNAEIKQALANTEGVLGASDQTKVSSDSDSAIKAATAGATIDVPKDADDGITLGSTDGSTPSIGISLPNADDASTAKRVAPGTVAYAGDNGSANAVQATEDGGVRMLTVIDKPSAPTEYDYKVRVPNGGHIELAEDGGAVVVGNENQPIMSVATPWAKDATGTPIRTYFTTDGLTLTQHVEHKAAGVVYPVTADPFWIPAAVIVAAFQSAVYACGVGYLAGAGWQIFWNGWVWSEIRRAGRQGCVEGVIARFIPWGAIKHLIKR
jgi:hypothetical protein